MDSVSKASGRDRQAALGWWLGIIGLAIFFVLLRWNNFDAPLIRDEGEYAYAAQLLRSGRLPYEHSFLQKPPMVAYSYTLANLLVPGAFWSPRILAGVFAAGATALLGYAARREFGPGVAMPAMWLMTPMILLPQVQQFTANTEMYLLLPLMATVAVYIHSRHVRDGRGHWLAAGALAALTLCYKYTAFPLLTFVFVVWTIEEWRRGGSFRKIAGRWLAALLGGTFAAAAVLGVFLLHDGGRRLWECTVAFNRFYAGSANFGLAGLWYWLVEFIRYWWILFLVPCLVICKRQPRLWFWAGLFLVAWLAAAGSFFGHYYIAIMPFWALLAAVALRNFAAWAAAKALQPEDSVRRMLTAIVLAIIVVPDAGWILRTPGQFAADRLASTPECLGSAVVGARVARLVAPGDLVYVAGSEPQILCYARRFSPTRFDIAYPLMVPTPLAKGYQAEAIGELQRSPPAAIVLVTSGLSWMTEPASPQDLPDFLRKLLAEQYEAVGGYVSDGGPGWWQEPIDREQMAHGALLLFKRKTP